jgi:hypothetical protein
MIGIQVVDEFKIRVERFHGELNEDLLHMLIVLIRSILGACVPSTLRDQVSRGD